MYLYLRSRARAGDLASASASSAQVESLIGVPGHPTKPFFFPFISRGNRPGELVPTFWRNRNIAGSWSPVSLARQPASAWLVSADAMAYTLPVDHAERALQSLLFGQRVSALALGAYFLRNDGFVVTGEAAADDVVLGLRRKFDYPSETDEEFDLLFSAKPPVDVEWFEAVDVVIRGDDDPDDGQADDEEGGANA